MSDAKHTALAELVAECERVNTRTLDQLGMGVIDLNVIRRARAALRQGAQPAGARRPVVITGGRLLGAILADEDTAPHPEAQPQASGGDKPLAYVPVHPKIGPLWADTFPAGVDDGDIAQRRPNYPRLALYTASQPAQASTQGAEALHTFLDAAAGEGLVLGGVDAADLYVEVFPERYATALAAPSHG